MTLDTQIYAALEAYLRTERSEPPATIEGDGSLKIRASFASDDCLRKLWLAARGYPHDPLSIEAEDTFNYGRVYHDEIRRAIRDAGIGLYDEEMEVKVSMPFGVITGHIDGLIPIGEDIYLLEAKTISDYGFSMLDKEGVHDSHARQAAIYMTGVEEFWKAMGGGKLAGAVFLYWKKPGGKSIPPSAPMERDILGKCRVFIVPASELPSIDSIEERLALVAGEEEPAPLTAEKVLTAQLDDDTARLAVLPWNCRYCAWQKACRPGAFPALHRKGSYRTDFTTYNSWSDGHALLEKV
jgi:hypothetical protein